MKKRIYIILVGIFVFFCTHTFIKMKFTYNYFGVNISSDIIQKKEQIKKLNKNRYNLQNDKAKYLHINPKDVYIPILMYHSISSINPVNNLLVPEKQFEEQIKWLKENEFTPMLMWQVVESFKTGQVLKKPVALTFDDGYFDNYTDAYRILKKYDMCGTFFVITDYIGKDSMYMDLKMLKEMKEDGMAIESHTSDHKRLYFKTKENQKKAILEAKNYLKKNLGIDNKYLCYPVGRYNKTTIEVAKELGIEAAVTTKEGQANIEDGLLSLDRIRIKPMSMKKFKKIFRNFK